MAEAFLKVALEKITSLIGDNVGSIIGVDDEMRKLESIFTAIQAVLEDAELNHLESRVIQNWLLKLNYITYEIDDILDECATHVARSKQLQLHGVRHGLKKILFRYKIAERIKQALQKLDQIAAEREKFHLRESDFRRSSDAAAPVLAREMGFLLNEPQHIFGRDDEKEEIVDILVNGVKDEQGISVLPILGMGGLGKTTLAQLVFNDPRVVDHFYTKIWVCVSDNFDVRTLIKAIIEFVTRKGDAADLVHLPALQRRLLDLLKQKRYLLVLDDVWNDDEDKWSQLRNVLSCGLVGSSIIVTTRLPKTAEIMGTIPAHELKGLSDDICWMLFKHRAFGCGEGESFPNLEAIGMKIVKKCAGVPLVAKVLGGLLRSKRLEKDWIQVKDSNIKDQGEAILPVLRLSYHHLPLEFRQCFAYCAIFPKDFRITKDDLLNRWMAHGYISSNGILDAEDVGEQIMNGLIARSLLQIDDDNSRRYLKITTNSRRYLKITMHDLVHDLAQSIIENKSPGARLEILCPNASTSKFREVNFGSQCVAFPKTALDEMDISSILTKFNRLRVLDASGERIWDLPSNFGRLKHLRLLNLSSSMVRTLPDSLCNIWNLQVLILNYCRNLVRFPKKMRSLKNLLHLHFENCESLRETPYAIGEMTSLRSLSEFIVGHKKGHQLEELKCLNLGGKLRIRHLERVKKPDDAKKANLIQKSNLQDLILEWEACNKPNVEDMHERILEALQPHSNVESLNIRWFQGRHFPNWMKNSNFPKLVRIVVSDCLNLLEMHLEGFPHLEVLHLDRVGIEYLGGGGNIENICFLALKEIQLYRLENMKRLFMGEVERDMCPNLVRLIIHNCPSVVLPPLNFNLEGFPHLELLHLSDVNIEYLCGGGNVVNICFPALKQIELDCMKNMKGLFKGEVGRDMCPNLIKLWVQNCPSLVLPPLNFNLEEFNCDNLLTLASLSKVESLRKLSVHIGKDLTCIPCDLAERFPNLIKLTFEEANENCVPVNGLQGFNFLQRLEINYSGKIKCLSKNWFSHNSNIEEISIFFCFKLVDVAEEIKHLHSLKRIYFNTLSEMVYVPNAIKHINSLERLSLENLKELIALPDWLEDLKSLNDLSIQSCPKLVSLPDSIKTMTNLQHLTVYKCPNIKNRCEKGKGEDWHKIAHIPKLKFI